MAIADSLRTLITASSGPLPFDMWCSDPKEQAEGIMDVAEELKCALEGVPPRAVSLVRTIMIAASKRGGLICKPLRAVARAPARSAFVETEAGTTTDEDEVKELESPKKIGRAHV